MASYANNSVVPLVAASAPGAPLKPGVAHFGAITGAIDGVVPSSLSPPLPPPPPALFLSAAASMAVAAGLNYSTIQSAAAAAAAAAASAASPLTTTVTTASHGKVKRRLRSYRISSSYKICSLI